MIKDKNVKKLLENINSSKSFQEALSIVDNAKKSLKIDINEKIFKNVLNKTKTDIDILDLLKCNYINPSRTTYREIINRIKKYDVAVDVFEQAKTRITPNAQMYEVLIFKAKEYDERLRLVNEMKSENIIPTDSIYSILIEKNSDFYEIIGLIKDMVQNKIKIRDKIYNHIINLISNEEQYNEFLNLIGLLKDNGIKFSKDIEANIVNQKKLILEKNNSTKIKKIQEEERLKNKLLSDDNEISNNIYDENVEPKKNSFKKTKGEHSKIQNNIISDQELRNRYFNTNNKNNSQLFIINSDEALDNHINFLSKEIEVKNIYIASGFVYKSGLKCIEPSLEYALNNQGNIKFIIGSLQEYNKISNEENQKIEGMDKNTAIYINYLLINNKIRVRTFEEKFFHGKFYLLEGKEKDCVIIGSSNVSSSGFYGNKELNLLYILDKNLNKNNEYMQWFNLLWDKSTEIKSINENYFVDIETYYDSYIPINNIKKIENKNVQRRIAELTDEDVKKRLNLWMDKEPDNIFTNLGVKSLEDYILLEYKKYDLLVLESFEFGNSYYYFSGMNVQTLIDTIKSLTKKEIFNLSEMEKRGYHIKDDKKLEISINSLFIKRVK